MKLLSGSSIVHNKTWSNNNANKPPGLYVIYLIIYPRSAVQIFPFTTYLLLVFFLLSFYCSTTSFLQRSINCAFFFSTRKNKCLIMPLLMSYSRNEIKGKVFKFINKFYDCSWRKMTSEAPLICSWIPTMLLLLGEKEISLYTFPQSLRKGHFSGIQWMLL